MITRHWQFGLAAGAALVLAACGGGGQEPTASARETAQSLESSKHPAARLLIPGGPINSTVQDKIDPRLLRARGETQVWVTLRDAPLSAHGAALAAVDGQATALATRNLASAARQSMKDQKATLRSKQDGIAASLVSLGARELARVNVAHNAIAVKVDAARLPQIAALPGVLRVRPVIHYERTLLETVPYIGAAAAQSAGVDGRGVKVAVLDSGIDYTHRNLGGAGTAAAYAAAYGAAPGPDPKQTTRDGLFPTVKVVDGFDFVGDTWPNCPASEPDCDTDALRTEDDDPIDAPSAVPITDGGHGTHVADIIAGRSADGTHKGVAPGASLVAVKVCSSVSTSCNGISLLKAMDFALDPNGDGDTSDMVDVINLSLGSSYGQKEDDLSQATANAVAAGVVVVASAGNSADRPYILGSPSSTPGVISVAQTQVPSATTFAVRVNSPAAIAGSYGNTATNDWAPVGAGFTGDVVFVGTACPGQALRADPKGKVALIDRGTCAVSLKVDAAAKAGAIGALIGLIAPGDAVSFSFGGGTTFVPTVVIQQSLASAIKANVAAPVNVTVNPSTEVALVGGMAGTSSRGPSISFQHIKPDIGAPGASVSALVGTGNGEEAFGGTSGAAPMVSGSAALMLQKFPKHSPIQVKAMLMNSAHTEIFTNPAASPGLLAPITRIGGGEVRVLRALLLDSAAWNPKSKSASLSFGAQEVAGNERFEQELRVRNFASHARVFNVTKSFRFADDEASGAVRIEVPSHIVVPGNGSTTVHVRLHVNAAKLPSWSLNGGTNGGNGALLDAHEFDGYLTLKSGSDTLSVPWHILPRKAADTEVADNSIRSGDDLKLRNSGVEVGGFDVFALTGTSAKIPTSELPGPGDNRAVVDLRAVGVRFIPKEVAGTDLLEFAIASRGRRAHPNYPAGFEVDIDVDRDGAPDFAVFNSELGAFASSGQNVVNVFNLATGALSAFFFTDADLNSANVIMTVPLAAVGLTPSTQFDFVALGFDNYFTGEVTDVVGPMRFTPNTPRFVTDLDFGEVPAHGKLDLATFELRGGAAASPSQTGLLVMLRKNAEQEAEIVRVRR